MPFCGEVAYAPIGTRTWRVTTAFTYTAPDGRTIFVPAGFVTDGASVPRPLWFLFPPFNGEYDAAAIVHDYLCRNAEALGAVWGLEVTRAYADQVMNWCMEDLRVRRHRRRIIYRAIRLGGAWAWKKNRDREVPGSLAAA